MLGPPQRQPLLEGALSFRFPFSGVMRHVAGMSARRYERTCLLRPIGGDRSRQTGVSPDLKTVSEVRFK